MADLPLGSVPLSTLEDSDNIIFTEGQLAKKIAYSDVKADMLGSANLATTAPKAKEAINELVQDLLESTGYGIISGGVVSAQSTPNMTVQATGCTLKTATGARQVVAANPTLSVTTADTTNPRKDIIYVDSIGVIQYLQGTASATPTAPTTPTGGSLLAEIYAAANATTITNANITDKRKTLISTDWLNSQLSESMQNIAKVNGSNIATDANIITTNNQVTYNNTNASTLNTPYKLGIISAPIGFIETYISVTNYGMQYYHSIGYDLMYMRSLNNGVWGNWILLSNTKRTPVIATPGAGMTIVRQNIYIENKTLYGEITVGKTDGTLFDINTFLLFSIPSTGLNYNRTVMKSHWSDISVLVNGTGTSTILANGNCYVANSTVGTKYLSISFAMALEV